MDLCQGYKPDGIRCRITWGLNNRGYCRLHDWQGLPMCKGFKPDGIRCRVTRGLDDLGYCRFHDWQGLPRCQGFELGTRVECKKPAKLNYAYCCAAHDPLIPHVAPTVLDPLDFYLRGRVEEGVVARYKNYDIYNSEPLDLDTRGAVELDHVAEKQCFTFVLSSMGLREGEDDFELVTDMLRESVVNKVGNLAFTRKSTNRIKGSGVWHYLDDSRTGHLGAHQTLTSYLRAATYDGESLGRNVTRRITRNMGRAMRRS